MERIGCSKTDDFLTTKLSLGIVFNGPFEKLQQLKKDIAEAAESKDIQIIYQKLSPTKLFITEQTTQASETGK